VLTLANSFNVVQHVRVDHRGPNIVAPDAPPLLPHWSRAPPLVEQDEYEHSCFKNLLEDAA